MKITPKMQQDIEVRARKDANKLLHDAYDEVMKETKECLGERPDEEIYQEISRLQLAAERDIFSKREEVYVERVKALVAWVEAQPEPPLPERTLRKMNPLHFVPLVGIFVHPWK